MSRMCVHRPDLRCWHGGMCSSLDVRGNVVYCGLLPNPSGFMMPPKLCGSRVSIHVLLRGRGKD